MPINGDQAQNHSDQGMTESDILACQRVAQIRNEIIIFRSTGPWSRPHIENGHPTKPFHVKGKSSTWGPHAGFIPLNSRYSKAISQKDIDKGVRLNNEAIKGRFARPVSLFLTQKYIDAYLTPKRGMTARPAVETITTPRDDVMYFYCRKPNEQDRAGNERHVFLGKRTNRGAWEIFVFPDGAAQTQSRALFLQESSAEQLLVMAVPGSDLPITGDYDLFAVCPSWGDYGSLDMKMDPTLDDPRQNASFARTRQKANMNALPHQVAMKQRAMESMRKIQDAASPEDPDRGNITPRIFQVIVQLNAAMGVAYGAGMKIGQPNEYQGGIVNQRVHHNAESGRPFAPGAEEGFPLTVFHPHNHVGPYTFRNAVINDINDLRRYFKNIHHGGYYVPRNHAWKIESFKAKLPAFPIRGMR